MSTLKPVTTSNPCPVCGGGHKCSYGDDGLIVCGRVSGPVEGFRHFGASEKDPQWNLFRKDEGNMVMSFTRQPDRKLIRPVIDMTTEADRFAANLSPESRADLAARLGLPVDAVEAVPRIGFDPEGNFWTFPECDAAGRVVGINRRFLDGGKKVIKGGSRGLTIPAGWRDRPGPVLLVEGASDVLALAVCGLAVIGRPSNMGGVEHLAGLLADLEPDREVIVIGENDRKEDGLWPGRDGAKRTAESLAAKLVRPVSWAMVPAGFKDSRAWFSGQEPCLFLEVLGKHFLSSLEDKTTVGRAVFQSPGSPVPERDDDPHRLARLFLDGYRTFDGERTLARWESAFYKWEAGAYSQVAEECIRAELVQFIRGQFERDYEAMKAGPGKAPAAVRSVTQGLIANVIGALSAMCGVPSGVKQPGWLDGSGPAVTDSINTPTGSVNLAALVDGKTGAVTPPTPRLFTTTRTGVGYDPHAAAPREWLRFLGTVFPNDPDSVACLQQWFGYLLTPDNRQQKMLLMVGPTRSGKGTIAGVLRALLGEGTIAGPTFNSLASNFGLAPLLDRTVAVIDDARLSSRTDVATVAERLLTITGEGGIDVDRKHMPAVAGAKLNTRFVVISNELPKLGDASGALVGRMVVLRFTRSFFGKEDHGLKDRLLKELPGILNWAIEGWANLRKCGRFVQPARGRELVDEMHDLSSPVGAFVRERCRTGEGLSVPVSELFAEWRRWCEATGKRETGTEQTFGRDLRAVVPELDTVRPRAGGSRFRMFTGVAIRPDADHCADHDTHERTGSDQLGTTGEFEKPVEPVWSAQWSASGPHSGPQSSPGNPSVVRVVRDVSEIVSNIDEHEVKEGSGSSETAYMGRNKEMRGPCGPARPDPARLVSDRLAKGPATERELADLFTANGRTLEDLAAALLAAGARDHDRADGAVSWSIPSPERGGTMPPQVTL